MGVHVRRNTQLAWKRGLGVTNYRGIVSPAYAVFRLVRDDFPFYYHYLLRSNEYIGYFKTFSSGVIDSRLRLYPEVFGRLTAIVPPLNEETQIARFLDHETAKIDGLIREQERLIGLLQEKRQAVISHAVTKGLKPDVPMKDSGVEWLGRVPAHWTSSSIKRFCSLVKDGTHLPPPRVSEGIPLLSVRNIVGGEFVRRSDDSKISENDYVALCRSFTPQQRDVLLAIVGATLGKTAIISDAMGHFHIQRSLALFRADASKLNPHWLHWVFQSAGFQSLLWEYAGFSAQPGIYLGTLASFKIPVPPIKEQIEINEWIGRQIDPMNTLIKEAESAVLLMKERRSSLISAAVTGKIDIRNWQPPADSMVLNEGASELGVEETAAGRKV